MKTIALIPPRQPLNLPKKQTSVPTCSSCEGPLNGTGECRGCTK